MTVTKGVRLNNPGNIERGRDSWQGMSTLQDDPRFIRFDKPVYGLRAIMKIVLNYSHSYGLNTVREIIDRWAPPEENDTASYIVDCAKRLGISPDDDLNVEDDATLIRLTKSIVHHENGNAPEDQPPYFYEDNVFAAAAQLALS